MNHFNNVGVNRPGRSVFDLSYEKKFTCDMGQLIPVMADEMVPGDIFELSAETVIRFAPMVAPVMHEINAFIHYFFVPYRLLWDDWEEFITGGVDGLSDLTPPTWNPTGHNAIGTLWDYFGMPVGVVPTGALPLIFPLYAYNFIYNEYYRDQNVQTEIALSNMEVLNRCWTKDYFTSALPWQQRGQAPALPISGTSHAVFPGAITSGTTQVLWPTATGGTHSQLYSDTTNDNPSSTVGRTKQALEKNVAHSHSISKTSLDNNVVDLSSATTFNVADLRLAFQIQKWMERNARAGARYKEFIMAHYGEDIKDERLQRPEYVGGSRSPIIISEVLQTSSTDTETPQGNLAGHGITANRQYIGKYRAREFGVMMGIMSVMPRPAYQQGINRQWLRRTRFDFYTPEFANLSEQAIERAELFASNIEAENQTIFGYQGRYDEMRVKDNQICGLMRTDFAHWHLGRNFATAPALNGEFMECVPDKRIFAVTSEPGLFVNVGNIIKGIRPMPVMSNPGLIDH